MEVSSIAAAATANAMVKVQQEASVMVLKKALDVQQQGALQLLEAMPQVPAAPTAGGATGSVVDTWA